MPKVNKFIPEYTGTIYKDGVEYDKFLFQEELLNFRVQIQEEKAEGFSVIFDFDENKEVCHISSNGEMLKHPEFKNYSLRMAISLISGLEDKSLRKE